MNHSIFVDKEAKEKYSKANQKYWEGIDDIIKSNELSLKECFNNYQAFIQRRSLPKLLAYYELFKIIQDMPGSIIELGVFRGAGVFTWNHLLETFCPGDRLRQVYGFDHFEGYTKFQQEDGDLGSYFEDALEGDYMGSSYDIVKKLQLLHNNDSYFPGIIRTQIIPGNIKETIPVFVKENPGLRVSLLMIDVNLFEPLKAAFDYLYDLVLHGGVIAVSGYSAIPWKGEATAIETFFKERGLSQPKMQKFPWSTVPRAYFIKSK